MGFTRLTATKPTIAAISGWCLAGGLEVALWCDLRIGTPTARMGYPERRWGVPLVDGGTQRLPRVVGVEKALEMITSGDPIGAEEAQAQGLVDEVVSGDLAQGALAFAERIAAEGRPPVKIRDRNEKIEEAKARPGLFDDFRKAIARRARPVSCSDGTGVDRAGGRLESAARTSGSRGGRVPTGEWSNRLHAGVTASISG